MTNPDLEEEEIVLRVLHTADWHLGKRYRSFPEAERIRTGLAEQAGKLPPDEPMARAALERLAVR